MSSPPPPLDTADRARLMAELAAPYRRLRQFIYLAGSGSAALGAVVFLFRALAGRDLAVSLPTLALQLGILAGLIALTRYESRAQKRLQERILERLREKS